MTLAGSKSASFAVTVAGILFVGWLDYSTGPEIRLLALYLVPFLWACLTLGFGAAAVAALLSIATWLGTLWLTGMRFSSPWIWAINGCTEGLGFLMVAVLVARLRSSVARERQMARCDSLTDLVNRGEFMRLAAEAITESRQGNQPVSLVYIDLNNFKAVNDCFGHERGDVILKNCAARIQGCVRPQDTVARLGGDEFAVILPFTNSDNAQSLAASIEEAVNSDPTCQSIPVTASVGMACDPDNCADVAELLRRADEQMYNAKRSRPSARVGPMGWSIPPATSS